MDEEEEEHQETRREKIGGFIGVAGALFPGMVVAGFFPEADVLPLPLWVLVAGVMGTIGGAVYGEDRPVLTAVCWGVAAVGALVAIPIYVALRMRLSSTFFTYEFIIPGLLGGLPGLGMLALIKRLTRRPEAL